VCAARRRHTRATLGVVATAAIAGCAGDQHRSLGTHRFTFTGPVTARVEGGAEAAYAHQFSSTGPGFSIGLAVPPESRVFVGVEPDGTPNGGPDRGTLIFALDSFPEPGTYAPRALGAPDAGLRRARTVGVLLASSSAATIWRPVGGQVRFARARPGTRAKRPDREGRQIVAALEDASSTPTVRARRRPASGAPSARGA
jgi:hypothetical protein